VRHERSVIVPSDTKARAASAAHSKKIRPSGSAHLDAVIEAKTVGTEQCRAARQNYAKHYVQLKHGAPESRLT
jgi:hypothetical protein